MAQSSFLPLIFEKNLFIVDENTGKLNFKNSPDYETVEELNGRTLKFITNYSTASISNNFFIELYNSENKSNQSSPNTVNNFMKYVNDQSYNNMLIHRVESDFVIQTGAYKHPQQSSDKIEAVSYTHLTLPTILRV